MPTGIALRDVREQLFDAAERVLLRDGADALTSRAVTAEAGVAKGVLHRHFADFDAFLAELVLERIGRVEREAAALRAAAGTGSVLDNLSAALITVFSPVALAIVTLVGSRERLLSRLREQTPAGVPLLTEAQAMVADYLVAERDLGRVGPDADVDTLALTLIGTGHLLFAGWTPAPDEPAVRKVVATALSGAAQPM